MNTGSKPEVADADSFTENVRRETTKRLMVNSKNHSVLMLERELNRTNTSLNRAQATDYFVFFWKILKMSRI